MVGRAAKYSVFRCALGVYLLFHLVCLVPLASKVPSDARMLGESSENTLNAFFPNILCFWDLPAVAVALLLAGAGVSLLFALGVRDRLVGLILLYLGGVLFTTNPPISNSSMPFIGWILLAHAFVPRRCSKSGSGWAAYGVWSQSQPAYCLCTGSTPATTESRKSATGSSGNRSMHVRPCLRTSAPVSIAPDTSRRARVRYGVLLEPNEPDLRIARGRGRSDRTIRSAQS